jgi:nucleoside-diphosphate-sugar epimerase
MRALVTGSDGFLGRHIVPRLELIGYKVVPVPMRLDECIGIIGSTMDPFDVVIHLAANIQNIDARMKMGVRAYGDIHLDFLMAEYVQSRPPTQCYIYPSSCAIDSPEDPYAWVKRTGEEFCKTLRKNKELNVLTLRPFSGYGADQTNEYPFRAILERALDEQDPLEVWGSGMQIRDFIHVDDLADAFIWLINEGVSSSRPIEIGSGVGTRMLELAQMMAAAVGYKPEVKPLGDKPQASWTRIAGRNKEATDIRQLGWKPRITLAEGIQTAVMTVVNERSAK